MNTNLKQIIRSSTFSLVAMALGLFLLSSCDPTISSLEFDLPDSHSVDDLTPPEAAFSSAATDEDYLTYEFANASSSSTTYEWDFGDGETSTDLEPSHTYGDLGTYTVTLVSSDNLGVTSTFSEAIEVAVPLTAVKITPEIINGDFEDGTSGWKPSAFTGASTNAFNGSSDGSFILYDGTEVADKTKGAKYTTSTTMVPFSGDSRAGYQEITVSPNTEYTFEFVYAISTSNALNGGEQVIVEILDGHFPDAADAYVSSNSVTGPLGKGVGTTADGKGVFERIVSSFTSNATGKVSIWMYGITTTNDAWADNIKVYPTE